MKGEARPHACSHVDLLHSALDSMRTRLEGPVVRRGLTWDQWRVLRTLAEVGPQSMAELHAGTRITGPTLTRVVDRLAENALAYRNVDSMDRRRVKVHAADRGRRLWRTLEPELDDLEREALSRLSDDERRSLHRLLGALTN